MEFEAVKERAIWENKRLMVAFGLSGCRRNRSCSNVFNHCGCLGGHHIEWCIFKESGELVSIRLGNRVERCGVSQLAGGLASGFWKYFPSHPRFDKHHFSELMARGIYRLGFEDEEMFAPLDHLLTGHEKLELRLSMPREFWPQHWLDESTVRLDF